MRKLATVRKIDALEPIDGADLIETATIGGWKVVVKKGEFSVGQLAVYFEIDSFIPTELAPFLTKEGKEPREYNDIKGERLRTVRLRKQISQGLLLPINVVYNGVESVLAGLGIRLETIPVIIEEDMDVSDLLNIHKYEPPMSTQLAGMAKGNFPSFIPKTDEERCLSVDTLISTEKGLVKISDIVHNMVSVKFVHSFNHDLNTIELKPIIGRSEMSRKKGWVKITLKSGTTLICTKNHKIWCEDILAYREAKDLIKGQKFITKTD
jgi:RNA ligase (TIGR02306 family)